jgi:hypothetical protein
LWILWTVEVTVNDYPPAVFELEMEDFLKKKKGDCTALLPTIFLLFPDFIDDIRLP